MKDYGPMGQSIEGLLAALEFITPEQINMVAMIVEDRGPIDLTYPRRAAKIMDRDEQARRAQKSGGDVCEQYANRVPAAEYLMLKDCAREAAYAIATKDLIGIAWYGQSDYDRVVAPLLMALERSEF